MFHCVHQAIVRASLGIVVAGVADLLGLVLGIAIVHAGGEFALRQRDRLVGKVRGSEGPAAVASSSPRDRTGEVVRDTAGNVWTSLCGAVAGYSVAPSAAIAFYRGWIGGIVSVDDEHRSRLRSGPSAAYYLITVLLQSVPWVLVVGAGISIGFAVFGRFIGLDSPYTGPYVWPAFLLIPQQAVVDLCWIIGIAIPISVVASVFEFFA